MSTVPTAIDALVALAKQVTTGVQVLDGPPVTTENDYLAIGFTGQDGALDVENDITATAASGESAQESYTIQCQASSWTGDDSPKKTRDRVYEFYEQFRAAVIADPSVAGVVDRAWIDTAGLRQDVSNGSVATIPFTVHIDAFTTT